MAFPCMELGLRLVKGSQSEAIGWAAQALLQVPLGQLLKVVEEVVLPLCTAVEHLGIYGRLLPGGALKHRRSCI